MFNTFSTVADATKALFNQTQNGISSDLARALLIAFRKTVEETGPEESFLDGSVKREAILPVATDVARVIRSEMIHEMVARGASIKQLEHLQRLGDALTGVARALDTFAAEENQPSYHDRVHNLLILAVRLVRGRSLMAQEKTGPLDLLREMRDYVTAMGHDLGHDGTSNIRDGVYVPAYLEKKSYAYIEAILDMTQVPAPDRLYIKRSLLATDPELPGKIALYAHSMHFGTGALSPTRGSLCDQIESLPEDQRRDMRDLMGAMERDHRLTASALALKGADMVQSFGLDDDSWLQSSRAFHREVVRLTPDRPVLDETGKPKAAAQVFVMLNYVGAELCNHASHSAGKPHAFLKARFVDPETDRLFGPYLRYLQERMQQKAGPAVEGIAKQVAASSGFHLALA